MKPLQSQFDDLVKQFPDAVLAPSDGVHLVDIPALGLPDGWSLSKSDIRFVIPNGYPYSPPDCFWADAQLRLPGGQMPQNTLMGYVAPGQPNNGFLWFSWHVNEKWNPSGCNLLTYMKIIRNRFEERK